MTLDLQSRDVPEQVLSVVLEPDHPLPELRQVRTTHPLVEDVDRQQGDDPHHPAELERDGPAVEQELVVVEPVDLVPQPPPAEVVQRVGDVHEVLEELRRHVLVDRVVPGQLEGDLQHVEAEHADPGGAEITGVQLLHRRSARRMVGDHQVEDPVAQPRPRAARGSPPRGSAAST